MLALQAQQRFDVDRAGDNEGLFVFMQRDQLLGIVLLFEQYFTP